MKKQFSGGRIAMCPDQTQSYQKKNSPQTAFKSTLNPSAAIRLISFSAS